MRYALAGTNQPLAFADYTYDTLPAAIRDAVPTDAELGAAADEARNQLTDPGEDGQ